MPFHCGTRLEQGCAGRKAHGTGSAGALPGWRAPGDLLQSKGVPAGRSVEGLPEGADFRLALLPPAAALPAPSGRLSSAPHSPSPAATAAAAGILSNRHHPPCKRISTASAKCHHATASQCHPQTARGSPAPATQWPFNPSCHNSARLQTHCAQASGLPQSSRPPKNL